MKNTKWTRSEKLLFLTPGLFLGIVGVSIYGSRASRSIEAALENIGIPTTQSAKKNSCQSNLKQMGLGVFQYVRDYDEQYPLIATSGQSYGWADAIQPYIKSTQIYHCPKNVEVVSKNPTARGYTDYFYNARLSDLNQGRVNLAAQTVMFGEGTSSDARYAKLQLPQKWIDEPTSPARLHYQHKSATINGANYAFADGHVKWLPPQDVSTAPAKTGVWTFAIQ